MVPRKASTVVGAENFAPSTRLRGHHAAAQLHAICVKRIPLTGFGFPSGCYPYCTVDTQSPATCRQQADDRPQASPSTPSEVSSPSASLNRSEPHTPSRIQPAGYVASSGFRTLSTPCSPCDLADLFHSASALGVSLRGLDPRAAPYVLSNAGSLAVAARLTLQCDARLRIRGSRYAARSPPAAPRVNQVYHVGASLGFPLRGFLPLRWACDPANGPPAIPSRPSLPWPSR